MGQDPTYSLPFQNNTFGGAGPTHNAVGNVLNIQPVLPFTFGDWNVISRTIAVRPSAGDCTVRSTMRSLIRFSDTTYAPSCVARAEPCLEWLAAEAEHRTRAGGRACIVGEAWHKARHVD